MEEFTNSIGFKIFYSTIGVFMIGFSLFLFNMDHSKASNIVLVIPIFLILFALLIIISQFKRKIIVSVDNIVSINVFGRKEILTSNVKGCRISQKTIFIEPISSSNPKIIINNYSDLGNSEDLVSWLSTNFADLDADNLKQEHTELLHDSSLGFTEQERAQKLTMAKRISMAYNICGLIIGFAIIPFSNNYATTVFLLLCPLVGILMIMTSKGLIKFTSDGKKSVYPFILLGFTMPVFTMLLKSTEYEIYQYNSIWIPFAACGLLIFFILFTRGFNNSMQVNAQIIFMLIFSFMYAYGCTIQVNCAFDKSKPQVIHTSVYNIDIRRSKGTHYYLWIKSWDSDQKPKSVEVSSTTFYRYPTGSSINVYIKKGLLNIPWYYL